MTSRSEMSPSRREMRLGQRWIQSNRERTTVVPAPSHTRTGETRTHHGGLASTVPSARRRGACVGDPETAIRAPPPRRRLRRRGSVKGQRLFIPLGTPRLFFFAIGSAGDGRREE